VGDRAGVRACCRSLIVSGRSRSSKARDGSGVENARTSAPGEQIAVVRQSFSRNGAAAGACRVDEIETQAPADEREFLNGGKRLRARHASVLGPRGGVQALVKWRGLEPNFPVLDVRLAVEVHRRPSQDRVDLD